MAHDHDLDMPGVLVEPVDEFAMQADFERPLPRPGPPVLGRLQARRRGQHADVPGPDPAQRRVPGSVHLPRPLRRHLARSRGLLQRPVLQGRHTARSTRRGPSRKCRFEKKNPDDGDFAPIRRFLNGVDLTGAAQRNYLLANADIPEMINYAAVTAIVQHIDSSTKNFYMSQDAVTGRWEIIPWDLDHTWGNSCCWREQHLRDAGRARRQDQASSCGPCSRCRVARDVLPPAPHPGQRDPRHRDGSRPSTTRRSGRRSRGHARLRRAGRTVPGGPTRTSGPPCSTPSSPAAPSSPTTLGCPGNQRAAPNIVINEIQHSPTGGNGAEFVELYNPSRHGGRRPLRMVDLRRDRPRRSSRGP